MRDSGAVAFVLENERRSLCERVAADMFETQSSPYKDFLK